MAGVPGLAAAFAVTSAGRAVLAPPLRFPLAGVSLGSVLPALFSATGASMVEPLARAAPMDKAIRAKSMARLMARKKGHMGDPPD
jgi:hypothetical protein